MKKCRKGLSLALSAALSVSLCSGAAAAGPNAMPVERESSQRFANAVVQAQAYGLMDGYEDGSFGEEDALSRAMLVTILRQMSGETASPSAAQFTDVKADDWFAGPVAWAAGQGIATGYPDGSFHANQTLSRQELAVMCYQYAKAAGMPLSGGAQLSAYSDGAAVGEWAREAYGWCLSRGILTPTVGTKLSPAAQVTRAETAAAAVALYGMNPIDVDTIRTCKVDWSQAAQLPLTGWFTKEFDGGRTAKVYISDEASIRTYMTVVAVPDGVNTQTFLEEQGWLELADQKGEALFVLEPGPAGWGSAEQESAYLSAAMGLARGGRNAQGVGVFSTYGEFYLVGYGAGAAPLEAWAADFPIVVISQVYLDGQGAGQAYLDQVGAKEYDATNTSGYDAEIKNFDATLKECGISGPISRSEVPVPTWFVNYGTQDYSLSYWKAANDCVSTETDGVFYQDIRSDALQTQYANSQIVKENAAAQHGLSQVKVGSGAPDAAQIYDFLSIYTRYDNTFAYSNALAYRLDYTAARVSAQQQAAQGQILDTLQGEGGPVSILGRSDVSVDGHGTVQVGVFSFSDNSGDQRSDPREYMLYLPSGHQGEELPVLFVYPGNTQTDSIFLDSTQWWQIADREGIALVVVCETYNDAISVTHKDADLYYYAMMAVLRQQIDGTYADLDFSRVYGTGQSLGSMTTQGFARTNPEFFAAVASTSGIRLTDTVSNQPIPSYLQTGQSDLNGEGMSLLPDLFEGEDLQTWAQYLFQVNGLNTTVRGYSEEQFLDGRHKVYTWKNAAGIPVVQWGQTLLRAHNCYPGEMQHLWDFLKHYSFEVSQDGVITRSYSASGFEARDTVTLSTSTLVKDLDSKTTLATDWSQAAQLPLTGYYTKSIDVNGDGKLDDGRSVKVYLSEEASVRTYITVVAVPDGVETRAFLEREGWLDLMDQKGEALFVLEPGQGGWGTAEQEAGYLSAAISFLKSGKNAGGLSVFSTFGEFYLVGYEKGAAPLEAWAAENPIFVISQAYIKGQSAGQTLLSRAGAQAYDGETAGYGTIENLDETLTRIGKSRITRSDVPVPTWLAGYGANNDSENYWKAVNDCRANAENGVYYQDIQSDAYQTEHANQMILQKDPNAQNGISQVKITSASPSAQELYAFLSTYTRYDNSFAYSNALAYRLDYTAARVKAQQEALVLQVQTTLQGTMGPVAVLGQSDVEIPQHGTVQVGVVAFSDNNQDGKNDPREYILYIPDGFQGKKLPVVMIYAGGSQTDSIFFDATQWWQLAEEKGVALAFVCETYSSPTSVNHADSDRFYDALMAIFREQVDGKYASIDFTRVYGSGQSAGSMTTQNFARSNPEFFAAVASTSGVGAGSTGPIAAAPGSGGMIPVAMITGQSDAGNLNPNLWESEAVSLWAEYLLQVNKAQGDLDNYSSHAFLNSRYDVYTWENADGIPVFQWGQCLARAHNCYPGDMWQLWDFMSRYSCEKDADGNLVRYYSASAFAQDDAVVLK